MPLARLGLMSGGEWRVDSSKQEKHTTTILSARPEAIEQNNADRCFKLGMNSNIRGALRSVLNHSVIKKKKEGRKRQVIEIYRVSWRYCSSVFCPVQWMKQKPPGHSMHLSVNFFLYFFPTNFMKDFNCFFLIMFKHPSGCAMTVWSC